MRSGDLQKMARIPAPVPDIMRASSTLMHRQTSEQRMRQFEKVFDHEDKHYPYKYYFSTEAAHMLDRRAK